MIKAIFKSNSQKYLFYLQISELTLVHILNNFIIFIFILDVTTNDMSC